MCTMHVIAHDVELIWNLAYHSTKQITELFVAKECYVVRC